MRRKLLLILMIILSISLFLTACRSHTYQEERYFSDDYRQGMTLKVDNSVGDIVIRRSNQNRVSVIAKIQGYASSTGEARKIVDKTQINRSWSGNQLVIEANRQRNSMNYGRSITYAISIPAGFNVDINTSTGDIKIDEIEGDLNLTTSTGDILLESVFGNIRAKTSTGDIRVSNLEGEVDLTTSTGEIKLHLYNKRNSHNYLRSSTGDIEMIFFDDPSAFFDIKISTGDIYYFGQYFEDDLQAGRRGSSASYNIHTSTGEVYLGHR